MKSKIIGFLGFLLLLSMDTNAKTQTMIAGSEDTPFSLSAGGKFDMGGYSIPGDHGAGLKALAGSLGFSHYIGHNFEYGLNVLGAWATSISGKLFAEAGKLDGFKGGINLNARYMPHLSSGVRLGGLMSIGYSRLFGQGDKSMHEAFAFGDMNFDIGPSFMYQTASIFSFGAGLTYGMSDMRFGGSKANERLKQYSNLHTLRLPLDFHLRASDSIGVALAIEPGWRSLGGNHKFVHGVFYDVYAGVTVAL